MTHLAFRQWAEQCIVQKAAELYATFTPDERLVAQFGRLPADKFRTAKAELISLLGVDPAFDEQEIGHRLSVTIKHAANSGPDKLVV